MGRRLSFTFVLAASLGLTSLGEAATWSITEHGAIGDGKTLATAAIQRTIDACAAAGGGTVEISGGTFLSGAIFFKQGVNLHVARGATLKGTTDLGQYPLVRTRWEGTDRDWTAALVNFFGMHDVEISGEGTIDGSGTEFPRIQRTAPSNVPHPSPTPTPDTTGEDKSALTPTPAPARDRAATLPTATTANAGARRGRPRLIALQNCQHVRVANLRLQDQASWCLFMVYSEDITAENLMIRAEHTIPSSDGMDIDSCRGVHVTGCDIDVNDDCISIKSGKDEEGRRVNRPAENILIEKTHFGYGHGGVAMGSEVSGGIRHVEVRDCVVDSGNWAPIRFKSQPARGGVVEDIVYRNIDIRDAKMAVEFTLAWRMVPPIAPPAPHLTVVRGVRLINVSGRVKSAGSIRGLADSPIEDVTFTDCRLEAETGLVVEHIQKLDTHGLDLRVKSGDVILRN